MKILEICPYSAGICGVWSRVREEAFRLAERGNEVTVFSSNFVKGKDETAKPEENLKNLKIKRFKATKLGGESFMYWDFIKEGLKLNPEVIIVHNYRHIHTLKGLRLAKLLKKKNKNTKIFLVTHAPFVEGNITRKWHEKAIVNLYDRTVGPMTLNKYDKVLTISKWENPYLTSAGLIKEKIEYIPNGIPEEFFRIKKSKEENKILFLGRISPKKKLDTLVKAIPYIKDKKIKIEIIGPKEEPYASEIESMIKKIGVSNRIKIKEPVYDIEKKIKALDSCKIFVLPSRVEGMPQALIEVMARQKIVIGSNSIALRDLIEDGENGYLFDFDNPKSLAKTINEINENSSRENNRIRLNAKKSVEQFSWDKIIRKIEKAIES
jgi:glycosyltransferase involved in cell wall biosynthesis